MRRPLRHARVLLCAAALAGCAASPAPRPTPAGRPAAAETEAIATLARDFSAAYMRGDAAAMAALYTPDAVIFPNGAERITGREAIQRYWTLAPGNRVTMHRITPAEVRVEGELAYDYGVYEVSGERQGEAWGPTHGNYLIVWRRQPSGEWRMHLDMWNNRPRP